jgi:hypothetical protein
MKVELNHSSGTMRIFPPGLRCMSSLSVVALVDAALVVVGGD